MDGWIKTFPSDSVLRSCNQLLFKSTGGQQILTFGVFFHFRSIKTLFSAHCIIWTSFPQINSVETHYSRLFSQTLNLSTYMIKDLNINEYYNSYQHTVLIRLTFNINEKRNIEIKETSHMNTLIMFVSFSMTKLHNNTPFYPSCHPENKLLHRRRRGYKSWVGVWHHFRSRGAFS